MTKLFFKKITYLPILFYNNTYKEINQSFYHNNNNNKYNIDYRLWQTKKLINKYKIFKKFYFILFYSDILLADHKFLIDLVHNKSKLIKYLEINKKNFLFFYYNKKIYNYRLLLVLIKYYNFLYLGLPFFFNLKITNISFIKILIYIKKYANNKTII